MEEEIYTVGATILGSPGNLYLTKNLCVNLLGFLGTYGQAKDTMEARRDLKEIKQREDLRPEKRENGQHYLRPASYTLS